MLLSPQETLFGEPAPAPVRTTRPRKAERRALDRYDTPDWATAALLAAYPNICGLTLLDPCCGNGAMARLVGKRFRTVRTNDCDPAVAADTHLDAADPALYAEQPCWIVTNPPFNAAGDICYQAIQGLLGSVLQPGGALCGVAMLLRITFLEPCARSPIAPRNGRLWLERHPPTGQLVLPRIDFRGDGGSDTATACWFVWSRGGGEGIRVLTDEGLSRILGQKALRFEGTP